MELDFDFERLRKDLLDFYGTAMMFNPMAVMSVVNVEHADNEMLIHLAQSNGFDLEEYKINGKSL